MYKRILLFLCIYVSYSQLICKDTTSKINVFIGGRISENWCQVFPPGGDANNIWMAKFGRVPGLQSGIEFSRKGLIVGLQYMKNVYREWQYIDYNKILPPQSQPSFDSFYGEIRFHFIKLYLGYTLKMTKKMCFSASIRWGPEQIKVKNFTLGRFHRDSIVYGYAQFESRFSLGLDLKLAYKISRTASLVVGIHADRNLQNIVGDHSGKGPYLPDVPFENRFIYSSDYLGTNIGLLFTLKT